MNKTAEITFPLSPKFLLVMTWSKSAHDHSTIERDNVDRANVVRAANSDRFLFAHIGDKRIGKLAKEYKDSRPSITTQGLGPEEFASIAVARRQLTGQ